MLERNSKITRVLTRYVTLLNGKELTLAYHRLEGERVRVLHTYTTCPWDGHITHEWSYSTYDDADEMVKEETQWIEDADLQSLYSLAEKSGYDLDILVDRLIENCNVELFRYSDEKGYHDNRSAYMLYAYEELMEMCESYEEEY